MKVIILAAGLGSRISRHLGGNPKCTVDIGGSTLIRHTIELFNKNGINDIAICLGYKQDVIKEELKGFDIKYYYNPFYDVTNSIASMWFAKDFLNNDSEYLIMNGDVYIEQDIVDDLFKAEKSPLLLSDETRKEEGDYKLKYTNGILEKYGKELTGDDITGEYVGIAKLNRNYVPVFKKQLLKMIDEQKHGLWWENVLYELSHEQSVYVQNVEGKFWAEVDYIEDYQRILDFRKKYNK